VLAAKATRSPKNRIRAIRIKRDGSWLLQHKAWTLLDGVASTSPIKPARGRRG